MKQVLHSKAGLTVVRDVPLPPCPPGGVLVRTACSAISPGTDRSRLQETQRSLLERARERPDLVRRTLESVVREGVRETRDAVRRKLEEESAGGYSSAGRVLEVGPRVAGLSPGDLVACAGVGHAVHAEVAAVPANLCARIPQGVALPAASLTTIAAIALHAIRLSDVRVGERVAVVGCGLVGQLACRLLGSAGALTIALDLDRARVEQAVAGGADHGLEAGEDAAERVRDLTGGIGADHAIVTAGAPSSDPLLLGAQALRDRGSLTLVGAVPVELPREPLYRKELSFRVSRSYGPGRYDAAYEERGLDYPIGYVRWTEQRNMEAVLDLQARGRLRLEDLVDEVVPVDAAADAFARVTGPPEGRPRGALVLEYPPDADAGVLAVPEAGEAARVAPGAGEAVRVGAQAPRAADAPVRVAFVGIGGFAGDVLVPAFRAAGAALEVAAGGSGPSAEAAVRRLGFARAAPSEEAALEDPGVDAIVVGTRHESHARLTAAGLAAGKHVFCEKPLALTAPELDAVVAAARDAPGILAVGFNRRYSPLAVAMRDFLREPGGPVTAVYRVSAGAIGPDHWVHDLEEGGGRAIGEVCHFVDTLRFLAGAPVVEVHATGRPQDGVAVQARDTVLVSLTFADGSLGSIAYVARSAPGIPKERVEAFGEAGVAVLDDYRALDLHGSAGERRERARGGQRKGHDEEVAAFLDGARRGAAPVALDELAEVSAATLAVVESMRTGRAVRLEPAGRE